MLRFVATFFVWNICAGHQAPAFTAEQLPLEFDARLLTADEKRFLQAGLAFQNVYNGLLDGAWGPASQRALELYETKIGGDAFVSNAEVVLFALETYAIFERDGWVEQYNSGLDMSFLVPTASLQVGVPSDYFVNFDLAGTSFGYSLTFGNADQTVRLHSYTVAEATISPYTVRKPDIWISSGMTKAGLTLYTRSDYRRGGWSTIMLSASNLDAGILAAVSGSIHRGYAPQIGISSGRLSDGITTLAALLETADHVEPAAVPAPSPTLAFPTAEPPAAPPPEPDGPIGFGTGFLVSPDGHYLTNNHVIEACNSVTVNGVTATVVAQDASFDLALILTSVTPKEEPAKFAEKPARLNSDVTVIGFPLPEILGGLNVTRGAVTSLKGIGGDGVRMQISAPVQPGNSGGPVINSSGLVVGIVVSKLDAGLVEEAIGDIPQNVNFAIRAEIAKLFLYQNGVDPIEAEEGQAVAPEALAELAQGFTRQIICN